MSKGQQTIVHIFLLIFVVFGGFLIWTTDDTINSEVQHNSGDYNTIAETKLKADNYPYRMTKEINFTMNNLAMERITWEEPVPDIEEFHENHLERFSNRLATQVAPIGNCNGPKIQDISLSGDYLTEYTIELSDKWMTCSSSSGSTEASIEMDKETFVVNNSNNRYVRIGNYSSNFSRNLQDRLEKRASYDITATGVDECEDSSRTKAKERAFESAKSKIESYVLQRTNLEKTDGDEFNIGWINIDTEDADASGECSYDVESFECTYSDDCTGTGEDRECDTETGTGYEATCAWDTETVTISLSIMDNDYEIVTAEGVQNLEFKWDYIFEP